MAPIAIAISRLEATAKASAATVRTAAVLCANQWTLVIASAILIPLLTGRSATVEVGKGAAAACYRQPHIAALAALPAGLVFAPVDLGAHLLADTQHAVSAAPYHRAGAAILETHALLAERSLDAASRGLARIGARYVVACTAMSRLVTPVGDHPDTFFARLRRGEAMPFLTPVSMPDGSPFRVWRVAARPS